MTVVSTDRIEKKVLLKAPRAKVWNALADARAFGQWFGVDLTGSFAPGARLRGRVTHEGYQHVVMDVTVESMEPGRLLSWRWHPNAIDPGADYTAEPATLVVFELADVEDGTLLTVVETGFDGLPPARRAEAYRGNEQGWEGQMQAIERYVAGAA
jgi:uncharacterized protein YndB with AHSA1/START domain